MNPRRPLSAALVWSTTLALAAPALSGPPAPAPRATASASSAAATAKASPAPLAASKPSTSSARAPSAPPSKEDIRRADELFAVGNKFMTAGNYAEACPAYEQAFKLDPTVNGAFNLAECHEALGRTATAYLDWLEAARLAKAKNKQDKLARANERAKTLAGKLSTLKVSLPAKLSIDATRVVLVDDEAVDESWTTTPHAVDPGTHYVEVRAEGKVPFRTKVLVAPESDQQSVAVPELSPVAPPAPSTSAAVTAPTITSSSTPVPSSRPRLRDSSRGSTVLPGAIVLGVGVVSLGVGSYVAVRASSTKSDAESAYQANPSAGLDLSTARSQQLWSRLGLGIGVLCTGVGAYFLLTSPRAEKRAALAPVVAPGYGGISVVGRF